MMEVTIGCKVAMKCRDRLHELVKEEIEKKDSSTEEWKIAMESSFNRMDNEVREHAAAVLAGLMKGGDENLAEDFCGRAYRDANAIQKKRRQRSFSWF
ncbi:Proteasome activator subunit 4 [Camellia lanceoleosa]|uniref:Proteasome activator subunit 4 n=1 Tax=Camellia lanceoleosa TaxID=1840588 RepID=A0ACC0HVL7_9ERIC|nr:Proteasome activator subunit 4 [Camellia lanceoleosa]